MPITELHAECVWTQTTLQSHELQRPERESEAWEEWFESYCYLVDRVGELVVELCGRLSKHGVILDAEDRMFERVCDHYESREHAVFNMIGVYSGGIVLRDDCLEREECFAVDFIALDRSDAQRRWRRLAAWWRGATALAALRGVGAQENKRRRVQ